MAADSLLYMCSLLYEGIDHSIPGNGGIDCYKFLTINQRLADTVSYLIFLFFGLLPVVLRKFKVPKDSIVDFNGDALPKSSARRGKNILLVALCLTFGIELGYKLSTKQLLYLLNPCHIITMLQVMIAPPVYTRLPNMITQRTRQFSMLLKCTQKSTIKS